MDRERLCNKLLVQLFCLCRELVHDMMSSAGRKLCFDGQELVQALVMHFEYDEKQGIPYCGHVLSLYSLRARWIFFWIFLLFLCY